MYVRTRRIRCGDRGCEYVDIVQGQCLQGRIIQRRLGTLGRRDQLSYQTVDGLIGLVQNWPRLKACTASATSTSASTPGAASRDRRCSSRCSSRPQLVGRLAEPVETIRNTTSARSRLCIQELVERARALPELAKH